MKAYRPGEILVVDGDSEFLTFAATTLHRRGHAVRVCAYAAEARQHLDRHAFDAVLCALNLPDGSGAEFCGWVKFARTSCRAPPSRWSLMPIWSSGPTIRSKRSCATSRPARRC